MRRLGSQIRRTSVLFAAWVVISQSYTAFHLGLGLVASIVIAWLHRSDVPAGEARPNWFRFALYIPWLLWKVILSGLHVSYLILHPRMPIDPKLIRYRTRLPDPVGVVILGNSITLTPGTITAEVNGGELVVHAMDDAAGEDLTSQALERKIAGIFGEQR